MHIKKIKWQTSPPHAFKFKYTSDFCYPFLFSHLYESVQTKDKNQFPEVRQRSLLEAA
jgi:hypothetical protein